LVNNAGIFLTKPFTDFTTEDFDALVSTNLLGFFYITQRTVKEMLKQKSGCIVSITGCRSLPGTGRSCERRDTPRGWWRSGSSLVKNESTLTTLDFDEDTGKRICSCRVTIVGVWSRCG
jgi:hypothetical protein